MGSAELASAGDPMLFRFVRAGEVRDVRATVVVEHTADLLVLWIPPGTPVMKSVLVDGRRPREAPLEQRFSLPRRHRPDTWHGTGVIKLIPLAERHSIWLFWNADGTLRNYYVNLESPHQLWADDGVRGIDTSDQVLDLVVAPDLAMRWKDEDEFAVATGLPAFWDDAGARAIRDEGERVAERVTRRLAPFDGSWDDFRPDPAWPLPTLPPDWDRPVVFDPVEV